ncbi:MAG TPA: 50S ribosomal protein L6 [Gemmatimonadales bacterium]|nr:50S ribosomal protein L6 [Gemmatimonadales bacterium]
MSRIGKRPVPLPKGVTASVAGNTVVIKGPRGELQHHVPAELGVKVEGGEVLVSRPSDESKHKALHGLTRTLVANMVEGVTKGYERSLEIVGVGYRAETKPYGVALVVGYSHPVEFKAPAGIKITADQPTTVKVAGNDKELVGRVAAEIRAVRPPEPYKGKGIRYTGEHVRRKAGKTGAGATK